MIRKKLHNAAGSLTVIVPKPFAELMGLKDKSEVEMDYESQGKKIIITALVDKKNYLKQGGQEVDEVATPLVGDAI